MNKPAQVLRLREGDLSLELWPEVGGSIAAFELAGEPPIALMRAASEHAAVECDATETSSFPLVPFSNRIENGRFTFQDKSVSLSPNMPPHPHPLHGHGWRSAWSVNSHGPNFAEFALRYPAGEWPWSYHARQRFELGRDYLEQEISVKNEGTTPMPVGLGLHPYFPRTDDVTLQAKLDKVWLGTSECIPRDLVALPSNWDFAAGRRVQDMELDHCFTGFEGAATIDWASRRVRLKISADPLFGSLVIYVPAGQDFFCVEPVSNVNDAFNLASRGVSGTGIVVLEPGQQLQGAARFSVERY